MEGAVWLNGEFVERDDARVSAFDAGFQHAVGLFETMIAHGQRVHRAHDHVDRLISSARRLGLSESLRAGPLAEAVRRVAERAGLDRARIRLTITGGDLNMLASTGQGPTDPTALIVAQRATRYPDEMFERGVMAVVAETRVNPLDPFAGHKTLSYWWRLRELQRAAGAGAGEALFLQISNHLAGGAVSNVFLVREGRLYTPIAMGEEPGEPGSLRSPVLPGITRADALGYARDMGVEVESRMLSINDLLGAEEAFLTNSSWGVLPLVALERSQIGDGRPGAMTLDLRARWLRDVAGDGA